MCSGYRTVLMCNSTITCDAECLFTCFIGHLCTFFGEVSFQTCSFFSWVILLLLIFMLVIKLSLKIFTSGNKVGKLSIKIDVESLYVIFLVSFHSFYQLNMCHNTMENIDTQSHQENHS